MKTNINANQVRTFLLLTAQAEINEYKERETKINSKTSSEMLRLFDSIEISFQNPTENGYQFRRGSERHSFDSGNLTIKQIDINEPDIPINKSRTMQSDFSLKKTDISYRKIKENEPKKEFFVKKATMIRKYFTYLKELADKFIMHIKIERRKRVQRGKTLKIQKSQTIKNHLLFNDDIEQRSHLIKKNSNSDNLEVFAIDNNKTMERKYNSNKALGSILPKIRESHNQINKFVSKGINKITVKKKSTLFFLKPKLL